MKKALSVFLVLILLIASIPVTNAEMDPYGTGYCVVELHEEFPEGKSVSQSTRYFVKALSYYDESGDKKWTMELHGSFTFNETSVFCSNAYVTYSIYDSNWKYKSRNAWPNGNTAHGTLTMERTLFGITIQTQTKSLTITCDANGNVS